MDKKKLLSLLKREEGIKLDYKLKLDLSTESGRKELAKDVCAMANSRGGRGYIIIGIEDKTKNIVGINQGDITEEQLQQIVSSRIEPPIPISLEYIKVSETLVGIINIYDGYQKPYQFKENGAFYVRRGSTTDTMRKGEIISALTENLSLFAENCILRNNNIDCIDEELLSGYFFNQNIKINSANRMELLEKTSIICYDKEDSKYYYTLGGALVFCPNNNFFIPQNMIKITNGINISYEGYIIIRGTLTHMIHQCELVFNDLLPEIYPIDALMEGIKNAVIFRDYTMANSIIEVGLYEDNITIVSPGVFSREYRDSNLKYTKRNMWIYEKLMTLDTHKNAPSSLGGFSKIKRAFKGRGKVTFLNIPLEDCFKVIYPGLKSFKL